MDEPSARRSQFDLQQVALMMFICAVTAALAGYAIRSASADAGGSKFWIVALAAVPVLLTVVVRWMLVLSNRVRGRKM